MLFTGFKSLENRVPMDLLNGESSCVWLNSLSNLFVRLPRETPGLFLGRPCTDLYTWNNNQQIVQGFLTLYQPILINLVIGFDLGEVHLLQ